MGFSWMPVIAAGGFADFYDALLEEFRNGIFLFDSPWDIFVSMLDVAVTALALFYILKLISETRAWQLIKGLLWLFMFTVIAGWLGLKTINYALVNSISVLALGLVVIFQPELRRALESVGRNSSNIFVPREDETSQGKFLHNIVESLVVACQSMADEKTGALIIIERNTKLGDLIESGTAVILDAELTSTALRQIFYHNSPMHDGAVIIRNGRIYAARVHVPLSDSYQLRREMGTRHRAAIGASEIGDTISIVCSEEHGTISIALRGRLYTLENADALRTVLHRLMNTDSVLDDTTLPKRLRKLLRLDRTKQYEEEQALDAAQSQATKETLAQIAEDIDETSLAPFHNFEVTTKPHKSRAMLIGIALSVALGLWFYVRITTNPIITRNFSVPIMVNGTETLEANHLDYYNAANQATIVLRGRERTLRDIDASQVTATIDFSTITKANVYEIPVQVTVQSVSVLSYKVDMRNPDAVTVSVFESGKLNSDGTTKTSAE